MTTNLHETIQAALARYNALPPEDQRKMRAAQRKSWVVGEFMLSHPEVTRAYAEKIFDNIELGR